MGRGQLDEIVSKCFTDGKQRGKQSQRVIPPAFVEKMEIKRGHAVLDL